MIRDLLYAVCRVNTNVKSSSIHVVASVRSEVLQEINRVGPEVSRDVEDRGVKVNWAVRSDDPNQPILTIIESKIRASEIERDQIPTSDIWETYFPNSIFGRNIKRYLLDISMYKPRNIISLLSKSAANRPADARLTFSAFRDAQNDFSKRSWTEIEEGLLGQYESEHVRAIKAILTSYKLRFTIIQIQDRVSEVKKFDHRVQKYFRKNIDTSDAIESLYKLGAVGNVFRAEDSDPQSLRNHWAYRDDYDPALDKPFEIHESLRTELRIPFENH